MDWRLQLIVMKSELRVIVDQHATVNQPLSLVLTARQGPRADPHGCGHIDPPQGLAAILAPFRGGEEPSPRASLDPLPLRPRRGRGEDGRIPVGAPAIPRPAGWGRWPGPRGPRGTRRPLSAGRQLSLSRNKVTLGEPGVGSMSHPCIPIHPLGWPSAPPPCRPRDPVPEGQGGGRGQAPSLRGPSPRRPWPRRPRPLPWGLALAYGSGHRGPRKRRSGSFRARGRVLCES